MWKKHRKLNKLAVLIAACLILGLSVQPGDLRSGICEEAFKTCMEDWYNQAWGYIGTLYCAMGWAFCKKYIDSA